MLPYKSNNITYQDFYVTFMHLTHFQHPKAITEQLFLHFSSKCPVKRGYILDSI